MRVELVSGIWPPDVGGPATHAPELAEFLCSRGHDVVVVTTADRAPATTPYPLRWISRTLPPGLRHAWTVALVVSAARSSEVVYATSMIGRSGLGALVARRPLVVRLVGDPAYERALRRGLTDGALEDFQGERGVRIALLRAFRNLPLRRASRIVIPSAFLAEIAASWGIDRSRIAILPNPVSPPPLAPRDELRRRYGFDGPTLVFAGRFVVQKSLEVAVEAVGTTAGIALVLAGDGPERARIEAAARERGLAGRTRFLGAQPRQTVFELLGAADAALLSSSTENFPFAIVEALSVGTPAIATAVGGVAEVVEDGRNGLLAPPDDPGALAAAIERFFADEALRKRLRSAAAASVADYLPMRTYGKLEEILRSAAA
jgi:glycosyltransferase involved in cell wall biosynthesis